MKLQPLRALCVLADADMNMSKAADILCTSQPAISKQIRQLEDHLGVQLLIRSKNRVEGITDIGKQVLEAARIISGATRDIERMASDHKALVAGRLTIATTHTHARYALQEIVRLFTRAQPHVSLHFVIALPNDIAGLVVAGKADLGLSTATPELPSGAVAMPCYLLPMVVIGQPDHAVFAVPELRMQDMAPHPLITYGDHHVVVQDFRKRFVEAGLRFQAAVCSAGVEVMKHYAAAGVGLAFIPAVSYEPSRDPNLAARSIDHLLPPHRVYAIARRGAYWPRHIFDFVEHINPALTRQVVQTALAGSTGKDEPLPGAHHSDLE